MPYPPQRTRAGLQAVAKFAQLVGICILAAFVGCESIHPDRQVEPVQQTLVGGGREFIARAAAPIAPPGKFATRRGYYVFYHDFDLDKDDPLFAELEELPDQVFGELKLPPSNTLVEVFLFDSQERYERYMRVHYSDLPNRRAYFLQGVRVNGKDDLKIFTAMGNNLHTDLRHELTHALLHGVLKDVPLWLDEGLAGYFELPPESAGLNAQHVEVLRRGHYQPDLARLEKLDKVSQMQKPEYREAWAWVHLMLRGDPAVKKVLQDYLQTLRTNSNPGLLLPRLREVLANPEQELVDHLEKIDLSQAPFEGK